MNRLFNLLLIGLCAGLLSACVQPREYSPEEIDRAWLSGETLPVEVGVKYSLDRETPENDTGMNVLIDVSHQCGFDYMWRFTNYLDEKGYRAIASQASLDKVLDPEGVSRVRVLFDKENNIFPFAWHPNFKYNVILTYQNEVNAPEYSERECEALKKFVEEGGALVLMTSGKENIPEGWSLNRLASIFGARFTAGIESVENEKYAGMDLTSQWEVIKETEAGIPVQARRAFEKGKVFITGSPKDLVLKKLSRASSQSQVEETAQENAVKEQFVEQTFSWLCQGQKIFPDKYRPVKNVGGGGGGAIYPELEKKLAGFVIYYAPNINMEQVHTVTEEFPKITEQIQDWLPSSAAEEPMYLILSAGNGGGWAVNRYRPRENGIITLSRESLISIYAHEFAHTIGGPANYKGEKAGYSPMDNQGEAHAGWFQGKINAVYNPDLREESVKRCQSYFDTQEYKELDLKRYAEDNEYASAFGKGKDWKKIWVIWQKMDDTYGAFWYPRWRHVQYTRWADKPKKKLTWEETIEDMSLAVGEDLFPFFRAMNTTLSRSTMGEIEVGGQKVTLSPSSIDPGLFPGKVKLEPLGEWSSGWNPGYLQGLRLLVR